MGRRHIRGAFGRAEGMGRGFARGMGSRARGAAHQARESAEYVRGTLYRSRDGKLLGVCKGLADHFGVRVKMVRIGVILLAIFTGFWPVVGLYLLAAVIMQLEPVIPVRDEDEQEFYHSYTASRSMALGRLKRKFENLDRRLQRMEDTVTSKEYDWERRFHGQA